jgi:hypothetical protein
LFQIQSYNFHFLGFNSESEAKLSFFSKEMSCSRLPGRTLTFDVPEFPIRSTTSVQIRVKEVTSTAKVLDDAGAGICEEVHGLSAWTGVGVRMSK